MIEASECTKGEGRSDRTVIDTDERVETRIVDTETIASSREGIEGDLEIYISLRKRQVVSGRSGKKRVQAEGWIIFILLSVHQKKMNRRERERAAEKDEDAEMRGKGWKVFLAGRPSFSHAPVNVLTGSVCATEEQVSYTQTKMDVVLLNTEHTLVPYATQT